MPSPSRPQTVQAKQKYDVVDQSRNPLPREAPPAPKRLLERNTGCAGKLHPRLRVSVHEDGMAMNLAGEDCELSTCEE